MSIEAHLASAQARVRQGDPVGDVGRDTYFLAVRYGYEGPLSSWTRSLMDADAPEHDAEPEPEPPAAEVDTQPPPMPE